MGIGSLSLSLSLRIGCLLWLPIRREQNAAQIPSQGAAATSLGTGGKEGRWLSASEHPRVGKDIDVQVELSDFRS